MMAALFELQRVMVVAAHPDDEVLGPGGTLARLADHGAEILIIIACESRPGNEHRAREAARRAAPVLGARSVIFLDFPNLAMETFPVKKASQALEEVMATFRPQGILVHHWGDLNRDHQTCFQAALTAARPFQGSPVRAFLCFETPSSTEWAAGSGCESFRPNLFIDITATRERKLEALRHYEMELRDFPHPRSAAGVDALSRTRGMTVGMEHAEAFELVRGVW